MSVLGSDAFGGTGALSVSWTDSGTGTAWSQSGGVVKSGGSGDDWASYTGASWPNDHWSEATIGTPGTNAIGAGNGVIVRQDATIANTNRYRFIFSGAGYEVAVETTGSFTSKSSGSGTTWAAGDRGYLDAQGTTITAKKNTTAGSGGTTVFSFTDSTFASGKAGIGYSSIDSVATLNSWQGGDFGAGGGGVSAPSSITLTGVQ